jgi:hypothetical protein
MGFVTSWMSAPVLPLVALNPASNAYPAGRHLGDVLGLTDVEPTLVPQSIVYGTSIFGVTGVAVGVFDLFAITGQPPKLNIPIPTILPPAVTNLNAGDGGQTQPETLSIVAPTISQVTVQATISAVGGGVAHKQTGPVDSDETAATNNATANDMDLVPATGNASGDGFYFGFASLWDSLCLLIGTAGAGTYTIAWKYWNSSSWVTLPTILNDMNDFKSVGQKHLNFNRPVDWATIDIASLGAMYYIKAEMTYTSLATQPKGTQAWILNY